jgi:hypothetical protein
MLRITIAAALLATAAAPAAAEVFSFGIGVGAPIYRPYYAEPAPAYRVYRGPVILGPAPEAPGVYHMEAARDVEASLRSRGFTEVSPLARHGHLYHGNAVDPGGNLVALQISIFSGEIVDAEILEPGRAIVRAPAIETYAPPPPVTSTAPVIPKQAVKQAPRQAPKQTAAQGSKPASNSVQSKYAPPPPPKPYTPPAAPAKKGTDPLVVY